QRIRMAALGRFTSTFTCTGANMSAGENARRERQQLLDSAPAWARAAKPWFIFHHRLRRLVGGMYGQKPFSYQIFASANPERREQHNVPTPQFRRRAKAKGKQP